MNYRTFGKLNWSVSEIGIGTWAIGGDKWGPQNDNESRKTLHTAIDHGINFIDTAQLYGNGHSEEIVWQVLKERTEENFIATKVPRIPDSPMPFTDYADGSLYFPRKYVIDACEKSLRRLSRDFIDLYQFHHWASAFNHSDEWYEAVHILKRDGKIRAAGVSVPDDTPDSVIGALVENRIDAVQVLYNIFEQAPNYNLLPVCRRHNIGVISRVPLFEGALTGKFNRKTRFHPNDIRQRMFDRKKMVILLKYVEEVKSLKNNYNPELSLAQYAIRFCLSNTAVSTVIPGMRSPEQVVHNVQAIDTVKCSMRELKEIHKFANVRTMLKNKKILSGAIIKRIKKYFFST